MSYKKENQVCPKCGFRMYLSKAYPNPFCPKCGYVDGISLLNIDKYHEPLSDMELYFKDSFSSILYGQNNKKNFILGPIYLSYRNHLLLGIIFCNFEFFSSFYLAKMFLSLYIALYVFIFHVIFLRLLYMCFFDIIIFKLAKIKLKKMSKRENYLEELKRHKPNSVVKAILCIIIWIICIYLFAYFY